MSVELEQSGLKTEFVEDISKFEPTKLRHVEKIEKVVLPSKEGLLFFVEYYIYSLKIYLLF
jgi:hypothetical protein